MKPRVPSLNIIRRAENIGPESIERIKETLSCVSFFEAKYIENVLQPTSRLGATIIGHGELRRLHLFLDRPITSERVAQLAAYIQDVLPPSSSRPVLVPTLPSDINETSGRNNRRVLTVAGSDDLIRERLLAREAVCSFYDLDTVPAGVWLADDYMTRVGIAKSNNRVESQMVRFLHGSLVSGTELLPPAVQLAPIEIQPVN